MPDHEPLPESAAEEFDRALSQPQTEKYVLRLYIAGSTPRSQTAIENVRRICVEFLRGRCSLEIIDIYQDPAMLEEDMILAAPTLIRRSPLPSRRLIGDLSERSKVLAGLELIAGA